MVAPTPSTYSADVRLVLYADSQTFRLAQVGGGRMIFDQPVILPGGSGEILVRIDRHECRWHATWQPSEQPRKTVIAEFRSADHTPAQSLQREPTI